VRHNDIVTANYSDYFSMFAIIRLMSNFIHLHTHSHYSLLNALPKIPELVSRAQEHNMPALALTDDSNLYGAIEFYKTCTREGIKPIIGIDAFVAPRTRHDKQSGVDNYWYRLVLLAKNNAGYKNLIQLVTKAYTEGFYYKPRIDYELIEQYSNGLICISPSFSGDIAKALEHDDREKAEQLIHWYQHIFPNEQFYIEHTRHPEIPGHTETMDTLLACAREHNIPRVAAHDVYYLNPTDRTARETLVAIRTNRQVGEGSGFDAYEDDFSFITPAQADEAFADDPEAIENTKKIADACDLNLELGTWVFPKFDTGTQTADEKLRELAYHGLEERGLPQSTEVTDRLAYELSVIQDKGYAVYFLIVADLLREAHERGIHTTIRGSVAGSLTTYCIRITNVDPLAYKLPFERFLNPERPKAPDIDMDFADNRRDEMIEYSREKYGTEKVAQIGTFGTMLARGSVRDVARALGHSYNDGDRIAKLIPFGTQGFPITIASALEMEPELKELYESDDTVREIMDMAQKIEGCARHISIHAAGVVIAPEAITEYVPLQYDPKGEDKLITQFDMHAVEDAGLVKFDFLGIRNLSILSEAVHRVKERYNVNIDIENIPLDDGKTFELLARGETVGLFQLNGSGMTRYLKELKPTTIHDINAMVALYRPGPMEFIPVYIERKHNPEKVRYLDERLKPILEQSHGVLTYQDDVLLIAVDLAGYTWLEADKLRKAMGKKIPEEMEAQKEKLVKGLKNGGMKENTAEALWRQIEPFAAYGFNKAHAASYGKVAYQTAYMKANYPVIYMASVLSADAGETDKIAEIVAECVRMGIDVLPPDINESFENFTVVADKDTETEKIRFGLYTIKNVGEGITHAIIEERTSNGAFESLADFLSRVHNRNLTKSTLDALIKAGAMDSFRQSRGDLLANLDNLIAFNREQAKEAGSGQDSLFENVGGDINVPTLRLEKATPLTQEEMLNGEKELLGVYVSGHPLDAYKEQMKDKEHNIKHLKESAHEGQTSVAGGLVEEVKSILTKKGDKMLFLRISDYAESIEVVVFPNIFEAHRDLCEERRCIVVKGRYSKRNDRPSIVAEKMKAL